MSNEKPMLHSKIWYDEAEPDNAFASKNSYCHGYNVTQEILPNATWSQYMYLLFTGQRATEQQSQLLEKLAVAIANPGMRDLSIRSAMNAGVGGSTSASCLIAALGVGAGQYGGAREVFTLVQSWQQFGQDLSAWQRFLQDPNAADSHQTVWASYEHAPGFDPNGDQCPTTVLDVLDYLCTLAPEGALHWLQQNRLALEAVSSMPLAITGVIAAAFYDLQLGAKQSEMLYLLLRLPGAAVHAIEQEHYGWRNFPFFGEHTELTNDPGSKGLPNVEGYQP